MPYSGVLIGVVVENGHAEVRTRDAFDGGAGRRADEAVETRDRSGRLEAIEAVRMCDVGRAVRFGQLVKALLLLAEVKFASSKSCGTRIAPYRMRPSPSRAFRSPILNPDTRPFPLPCSA